MSFNYSPKVFIFDFAQSYYLLIRTFLGFVSAFCTYIILGIIFISYLINGSLFTISWNINFFVFTLNFITVIPLLHILMIILYFVKIQKFKIEENNLRQMQEKISKEIQLDYPQKNLNYSNHKELVENTISISQQLIKNGLVDECIDLFNKQLDLLRETNLESLHSVPLLDMAYILSKICYEKGKLADAYNIIWSTIKIMDPNPNLLLLKAEIEFKQNKLKEGNLTRQKALKMKNKQEKRYETLNYYYKKHRE